MTPHMSQTADFDLQAEPERLAYSAYQSRSSGEDAGGQDRIPRS
jgi:hypothetical protein